ISSGRGDSLRVRGCAVQPRPSRVTLPMVSTSVRFLWGGCARYFAQSIDQFFFSRVARVVKAKRFGHPLGLAARLEPLVIVGGVVCRGLGGQTGRTPEIGPASGAEAAYAARARDEAERFQNARCGCDVFAANTCLPEVPRCDLQTIVDVAATVQVFEQNTEQ